MAGGLSSLCRECWVVRVLASIFLVQQKRKQTKAEEKPRETVVEEYKSSRLRVLVVEDDQGVAATLKDTIEEAVTNGECVVEANFETACKILHDEVFDAVVLD